MNIARVLYPVQVLGPGNRLGIWVVGCHRKCSGCSNPELWDRKAYYEVELNDFVKLIRPILQRGDLDGVVISGGEPFNQPQELLQLLCCLEQYTEDVLVYTGYLYQELKESTSEIKECLQHIGVLVDGPYQEQLNNNVLMRGSANQQVYILKSNLQSKYDNYLQTSKNEIQNFMTRDGMVSVGIHQKYFHEDLLNKSLEKGVIIDD